MALSDPPENPTFRINRRNGKKLLFERRRRFDSDRLAYYTDRGRTRFIFKYNVPRTRTCRPNGSFSIFFFSFFFTFIISGFRAKKKRVAYCKLLLTRTVNNILKRVRVSREKFEFKTHRQHERPRTRATWETWRNRRKKKIFF